MYATVFVTVFCNFFFFDFVEPFVGTQLKERGVTFVRNRLAVTAFVTAFYK